MRRFVIAALGVILHSSLFILNCSAQVITTVAGTTWVFPGDGKPAMDAPLGDLSGVVVDASGNVIASDSQNLIVIKVSPSGVLTVVAGNGLPGFSGDGGPAGSASLGGFVGGAIGGNPGPSAVALDAGGNLYIADTGNNRIRKVSPSGIITTVAGNGTHGFSGDGGPATSASLGYPAGVALDAAGNLYIADGNNNRIRKVDSSGTIATVAGNGNPGFSGDGGPATGASLSGPKAVAVDAAGNLSIADTKNNRIRKVGPGGVIATVAGGGNVLGDGGLATSAMLSRPEGIALDASGSLYIDDAQNNRIRKVSPNGIITTVAGNGQAGFSGDGGPATNAALSLTATPGAVADVPGTDGGVAVDAAGNLYIAGNRRLRKVNASGIITTIAGNGNFLFSGDGGPATSAALHLFFLLGEFGTDVAADGAGNLYIADSGNNRIRKVSPSGIITTVAGNGTAGFSGDGGPATSAALRTPSGVAVDAAGNLYISDSGNGRLRKVSTGGTITTLATGAAFGSGLALDAVGNLYVGQGFLARQLLKITPAGTVTTVAGGGTGLGDGGPATSAGLNGAFGVAVDALGNLYIAEAFNRRVRKVNTAGIITTVAGNGTAGFSGDGGPATTASLNFPLRVAVDRTGNLYIADSRIRKVDTNGIITTVAGNSNFLIGFSSGDGGPATSASLSQPSGVTLDTAGNLYIADTDNNRVREVLVAPPTFSVAPASLKFSAAAGAAVVPGQQIVISSGTPGLAWSAQARTASGGPWLNVSPASGVGVAPGTLTVRVTATGLAPGNYQGSVTIVAPLAFPSSQTVTVELTVASSQPPQLSVDASSLSFQTAVGAGNPPPQTLRISNTGGGTLNWAAQASTASGVNWLTLSAASGTASAGSPASLQVTVSVSGLPAGVHAGSIQVSSPLNGQTQTVAVTLLVVEQTQAILVSQTGLAFTGVAGGGVVPSQSFGILNTGQGTMGWTAQASTTSGGAWLTVSPSSGSSVANALQIPIVNVAANVTGLGPGQYIGQVQVSATGANNSPQVVTVTLNVLPAGSNPGVLVRPTGLIFVRQAGTSSPGSQTLSLATAATGTVETKASPATLSGGDWLDAVPRSAAFGSSSAGTITVQPALGSLAPGQYFGALSLLFSDFSSQIVNVLFVVVPGATAAPGGMAPDLASAGACVPSQLFLSERTLGRQNFQALVGGATNIEVQLKDDCGNPVPAAPGQAPPNVAASFFDFLGRPTGDPPVSLVHVGGGVYHGTWQPTRALDQAIMKVRADLAPLVPAEIQLSGSLKENLQAFFLSPGGLVNAASFAPGAALSPGAIVAAFGRNLATGTSGATSLPLSTNLGGTRLNVAGRDVPLFFTSPGQINAQLPFDLTPNSSQQAVVRTSVAGSDALTLPIPFTVAPASPGIFTTNSSGAGQGAILIAGTATVAAPAGSVPGQDSRPVQRGQEIIAIFSTGLGDVTNRPAPGAAASSNPLSQTLLSPTVTIGGVQADVSFSGLAPFFAGLYQVNASVPANAPTGDAVPVVMTIGGAASNTVTIAVQ